jgi:endoglucanase
MLSSYRSWVATVGLAMYLGTVAPVFAGGLVAVDQAGYPPIARKYAILTAYADSFHVVSTSTRDIVFRGAVEFASLGDPSTGLELYRADLSTLTRPGSYLVRTSAGDTSAWFSISDTVYAAVARAALRGFFYQRCGTALLAGNAGVWAHAACHATTDAFFHATAESTGYALSAGGWHDAGDYGKYIVNAGVTVGTMLLAYEIAPASFSSDATAIPESGNGVPDILDEVRYELNWMLTMQAGGGGVFFKITKTQFEGFIMPQNDTGFRSIYRISSTATGDFAAVMARASRTYRSFDPQFADRCLAAAGRAWEYLVAHPSIVPSGGFTNPSGTATGEYGDGDDSDERLWAAAELYLARGDAATHAYVQTNYASKGIITGSMSWGNVRPLAECAYMLGSLPGINTTVQQTIRSSLHTFCTNLIAQRDNNAFRNALGPREYYWGSNSQVLNNAVLLILGKATGGPAEWEAAALEQLHYVLGTNVHGHSFVTGIGRRSTLHPHHRPSASDGISAPVPGLLSGGPDQNVTQDPVLQAHFTSSTPPALCYVDDEGSYASNEIAINWNAPLVFVAGYFARTGSGPASVLHGSILPSEIQLQQNYPNPFNGSTVIPFTLSRAMDVELVVMDILGRQIDKIALGTLTPGTHQTVWDTGGARVSSGAYFYSIATAGRPLSVIRPLIVLR